MLFKNFKNFAGIENWKQKFSPLDNQDTVNNFKLRKTIQERETGP